MSEEIRRQEAEWQAVKQKLHVDETSLEPSKPTPEELERMRIAKINQEIEGLPEKERNVFYLLDRLRVAQMLEEIKQEVWKDGEIKSWPYNGLRIFIYPGGNVCKGSPNYRQEEDGAQVSQDGIEKGTRLIFDYVYPSVGLEDIYGQRFGFYEEVKGGQTWSTHGGEQGRTSSYTVKRLGFHRGIVEKRLVRYLSGGFESIEVYIGRYPFRREKWKPICSPQFYLVVRGGFNPESFHQLDPENLDETEARIFLERELVQDCIKREERWYLPKYFKSAIRAESAHIEQAMKYNSCPLYHGSSGRNLIDYYRDGKLTW